MDKTIIIATHNQGKAKEFKEFFSEMGYQIKTIADFPEIGEIEETGSTFEENAMIKAKTVADLLQLPVLADDSGLSVFALNGAPGVYSARYAGEPSSDKANNKKLLQALKNVPEKERGAEFVCTLVLYKPDEKPLIVTGKAPGVILNEEKGEGGFGYDPLFYVPELNKTFAELSMQEKNKISHRALAIQKLKQELPKWLEIK